MNRGRRWLVVAASAALLAGAWWWHDDRATRFLPPVDSAFVTRFAMPPAADSAQTRRELDELLALQASRSSADVAAAQADRKTEITRFYGALGLDPRQHEFPRVEKLAQRVENDVRIYVRAVKDHFRRLRPYEIEPRLDPCIENVKGDLSYPSGHAAFAWAMAEVLADLVPEKRSALEARAAEFARQRMVCGVHFPSDLAAGKQAAEWVMQGVRANMEYSIEAAEASVKLREELGLPLQRPAGTPQKRS